MVDILYSEVMTNMELSGYERFSPIYSYLLLLLQALTRF